MRDIAHILESEFRKNNLQERIFDNKFRRRWLNPFITLWMISLLPSFLIPILDKNSFILLIYTLIWFLFGLIFFYLKINPHAKNKLPEISNHQVQPNNKFFRHWANESYEEYQLKKSYEVIKKTTLSSDSQLNTDLLQEYSEYFDKKAGQKILTEMAKYIGGLILLF